MRQYIMNKIKEEAAQRSGKDSTTGSIMDMQRTTELDETQEDIVQDSVAQRRNEAIFRNLTFDQAGEPIHVKGLDPDKLINHHILPRYKVSRRKPLAESTAI